MNTSVKTTQKKSANRSVATAKTVNELMTDKYADLNKKLAQVLKNNPDFQQ
jgi:hypothetical protein